jgi:hypothetical protein
MNIPVKLAFNNQERVENFAGRVGSQIEADSLSLPSLKILFSKGKRFHQRKCIGDIPIPMNSTECR